MHQIILLMVKEYAEVLFHSRIDSFSLTICRWMKHCRHWSINSQPAAYLSPEGRSKLRSSIGNNCSWQAMKAYNLSKKQLSQSYGIYCCMTGNQMMHFRKPIYYHPNCIKPFTLWKPNHEIHRNIFSRFFRHVQRSENSKCRMPRGPRAMTTMTVSYILIHLLPHILPVILSIQRIKRLRASWMFSQCGIIMLLYQGLP
jgi:hypothetical protein